MTIDKSKSKNHFEFDNFNSFSSNITSIRGLAIIGIIIFHLGIMMFFYVNLNPFFIVLYRIGEVGVDIFTFLSGILLSVNLIHKKESDHSWKGWYRKRIIKIYPMLIIATLLYIGYYGAYSHFFDLNRIIVHMSALDTVPINPNAWNLMLAHWYVTFILTCYLIFPILYYLMKKNYKLMVLLGIIVYIIYALFANQYYIILKDIFTNVFNKDLEKVVSGAFTLRYFEFYFGMIIGFWIVDNEKKKVKILQDNRLGLFSFIIFIIACTLYLIFQVYSYSFYDIGPILLFPLIALFFIIFCNYLFYKKPMINKILKIFGMSSYENFLIHMVIIYLFSILLIHKGLFFITIPLIIMISTIFASFFYYLNSFIMEKQEYHKMILAFVCSLVLYTIILYLFNLEQSSFNGFSVILYCSILAASYLIFYLKEIIEFIKLKLMSRKNFKK